MATIKISDLHPTGADLFQDSENYLNELTDEELGLTQGGSRWSIFIDIDIHISRRR